MNWPDIERVPHSAVRAAVARRLFARVAARLSLEVELPDGVRPGTGPRIVLRRPGAFFHRLGVDGLIGVGESYMAGDWDAPDLPALLTELAARMSTLVPPRLQWIRRWYARRIPDDGSIAAARQNIHHHYDLSNDLFAAFLDKTMTYSSALFADGDTLEDAQRRKIDRLLDLAEVGPGSRVLEIGTGWGELAIRAAARGARVESITISEQQRKLAIERVADAGYADSVAVELRDYREAEGSYDAIVSVEMVEAVGERYWPVFFATLDRLLAPGGRVALQAITMPHDRMLATRDTYTWVQKYIFPGGLLPSVEALERAMSATSLRLAGQTRFGQDYARTLRLWRERFEAADVEDLGFDAIFRRMWTFYLAYSEAGFRSGYIDVRQLLLERSP
ncbi:cyclopropane-fatty-acyl-phospholipid synthase family protein [Actinoallomurus bryophytorum]|uniref:Cyclopropane-fatty-acyl-phospholipid synthase n=1 Tax=Actinoallomurus bryophytorum TaxID=1490222 RepID=A0A543CNX9_9ACTN|nr:cyclopropane-fatty-acyl-phospholipid synthase family protein [Actinoallomurus bryophytorum]TQL98806.1 cyclopropane-fatty-acyl-phospholipid synthase [Actinoallomurus bryophytorum]